MERRAQILDAAIEVFGQQGYRQGSLRDVADAVGLSVQGVLHHFPTKEALLLETLERRSTVRRERTDKILAEQGVFPLMRFFLEENLARPPLMRLFVTLAAEATDPSHPAHSYFVKRYVATHDVVRTAYLAAVAAGQAVDIDADVAAEQIIALCDGLQLQFLLRPGMDLLSAYDVAVDHLRLGGSDSDRRPR